MRKLITALVVPAFLLAGAALAQDKAKDAKAEKGKAVQKVIHEDDKVRVTETTFQPGDVGPNVVRGFRVSRALTAGTMERTWADGKKEKIDYKAGEVRAAGPDKQAFQNKNVGKSPFTFYTVNLKEPKK